MELHLPVITLDKKTIVRRLQHNPFTGDHIKTAVTVDGLFRIENITFERLSTHLLNNKQALKTIYYGFHLTPFGNFFIALTGQGILELGFTEANGTAYLEMVREKYQPAHMVMDDTRTKKIIHGIFNNDKKNSTKPIHALLHGTDFQIKVWSALLHIPYGYITSYENIAQFIGNPSALRAVGNAIAKNNLAYVIPCHRVIRKTGDIGNYRWGIHRKKIILSKELALK
ncbi:MAG: methylated-DNA--[protein]-cysteine S-methyltransferase [Spirochaetales bacterium]|nr:methylated-DNA--[protein]-cysteine S-methyltransferase [Spirochaetales bacterium]